MVRRRALRFALFFVCTWLAANVLGVDTLAAGMSVRAAAVVRSAITLDANGGFAVGGSPEFLIGLSGPPPLWGHSPAGRSGPLEVVRAGVNLVRVGPTWTGWTHRELEHVLAWDQAAVRLGLHTWVRLNTFAATRPRWLGDAHLTAIVHALTRSPFAAGIGLWQGADEPWSRGIPAHSLAFVYCLMTSRGRRSACAGEPPLDSQHLLVTILAPHGTTADLAPYSRVTDSLGVDVYPVTVENRFPDLHEVGIWTRRVARIARDHSAWTTLQICSTHAYDKHTRAYVLPSAYQERYMVYDAIINGARGISFFGGNNRHCWNQSDRRYGWNWTFWNTALVRLVKQIASPTALGPALDNAASNHVLRTNDPGTEAIGRVASTPLGNQLWVIAARSAAGVRRVAITGLPASVRSAAVDGEGRTLRITDGILSDTFRQYQVHVYRIQLTRSTSRTTTSRAGGTPAQ